MATKCRKLIAIRVEQLLKGCKPNNAVYRYHTTVSADRQVSSSFTFRMPAPSCSLSGSTTVFPDGPELAGIPCLHSGFIGAKDNGGCGDNWSYKTYKTPVK